MMAMIFSALALLGLPALLVWMAPRYSLVSSLSPAFWAYAWGILLGNVLPLDASTVELFQDTSVALAIPLLLFSANMRSWLRLAVPTLLSLLIWIPAVMMMAAFSASLYRDIVGEPQAVAAMASAVYVGGTPNMYAVHRAIGADIDLFNQTNLADLMFSGSFLMLALTVIPGLLRSWLLPFRASNEVIDVVLHETPPRWQQVLLALGAGLLVVGASAGLAWLLAGTTSGQAFQSYVIIFLTLLGLLASLWKPLRKLPGTYATGEFLFLVFCVAVGSRVQLAEILGGAFTTVIFMATTALGAMLVHTVVAKLFRIDADTTMITHIAGVFGPAFIGPVAERLGNREILVSGMTLGVINLALGNLIGLWEFAWLTGS